VELHKEFRDKGFEILAFPCDQFLSQEPGTNVDIKKLIKEKFRAEFPLFEKSEINGPNTCEVYKFLRHTTEALYDPENDVVQEIPWNFAKFLVDGANGQVLSYYNPRVSPLSLREEIKGIIERNTKEGELFVNKRKYKSKEEIEAEGEVTQTTGACGSGGEMCSKGAQACDKAGNRI
jgi:glutathione peroxidase